MYIMKYFKILFVALISVACLLTFACSSNTDNIILNEDLIAEIDIPTDMEGLKFGSIILPKETISKISENGSRLDFTLPKNYVYIAVNGTGEIIFANKGTYTCTSTCNGGCNVVKLGDYIGCSACPQNTTKECVGRFTEIVVDKGENYFNQIGDGNNGVLINLEKGINFVTKETNSDALNKNVLDFDVIMKHPRIEAEFNNKLWKDKKPNSENSKESLVDVFGKVISLFIPLEMYYNSEIPFVHGKPSCNCDSGSSGCKLEAIKKALVVIGHTCVSGECKSCTMKW